VGFPTKPLALTNRAVSLTLVRDAAHVLFGERIASRADQSAEANQCPRQTRVLKGPCGI